MTYGDVQVVRVGTKTGPSSWAVNAGHRFPDPDVVTVRQAINCLSCENISHNAGELRKCSCLKEPRLQDEVC
jgi:hypothetical protein